jgi:AraC family transcriptional regulator of adaptative response/methylated-DNA-[protein]-cysteine methyltransferase
MNTTTRRPGRAAARAAAIQHDPRWTAVLARDARADGTFVFAVRTTGVFCRPSCAARRPKPQNVELFADAAAAQRAGYRACRRCAPVGRAPAREQADLVAALCRVIDAAESPPSLRELAADAGLSPWHLQRVFKAAVGLSPREYAAARRRERVRDALAAGAPVTAALHAAGYGSSGRFYGEAETVLGMAPARYRAGGVGEVVQFATAPCALGHVLAAATAKGVCAILLGDEPRALGDELRQRFPRAELRPAGADFAATLTAVCGLVDAPGSRCELPLDVRGTAFQQRVWQALRTIPAGARVSYTQLAARLGMPNGSRAVARACAQNPIAVAVPCHRVVRKGGELAGYRWGLARKRALLAREAEGGDGKSR